MIPETTKIGKRGTIVIPVALRQKYGLEEGSKLIVEALPEGVLLRPGVYISTGRVTTGRKSSLWRHCLKVCFCVLW